MLSARNSDFILILNLTTMTEIGKGTKLSLLGKKNGFIKVSFTILSN